MRQMIRGEEFSDKVMLFLSKKVMVGVNVFLDVLLKICPPSPQKKGQYVKLFLQNSTFASPKVICFFKVSFRMNFLRTGYRK